jgi:hypothetical protein
MKRKGAKATAPGVLPWEMNKNQAGLDVETLNRKGFQQLKYVFFPVGGYRRKRVCRAGSTKDF